MTILLTLLFGLCLMSLAAASRLSQLHPVLINVGAFYKFRFIITGVLLPLYRSRLTPSIAGRSALLPILYLVLIVVFHYPVVPRLVEVAFGAAEAVTWGVFVFWFVENPEKCRFLRWSVIQWLGTCSYSIYLWQQLFATKRRGTTCI